MRRSARLLPLAALAAALVTGACSATPTLPVVPATPATAAPAVAVTPGPTPTTPTRSSATTPTPTPTTPATQADGDLAAALAYLDDQATSVAFTDWARLLGAAPDRQAVIAGLPDLSKTHAIAAGSLLPYAATLHDNWPFDIADLTWQADIVTTGMPYSVLQFRDSVDLSGLPALLTGRAYVPGAEVAGATTWSHRLDPNKRFLVNGPQMMTNLGLLVAQHRLVVAASPESLAAALQAGAGSAKGTALTLAGALGAPYAALISIDPAWCSKLAGATGSGPGLSGVSPTQGLALGFVEPAPAGGASIRIELAFADATTAGHDLPLRLDLASVAMAADGQPWATTVMVLSNGRTAGPLLLADGTPVDGRPSLALTAWLRRDLPFAACN